MCHCGTNQLLVGSLFTKRERLQSTVLIVKSLEVSFFRKQQHATCFILYFSSFAINVKRPVLRNLYLLIACLSSQTYCMSKFILFNASINLFKSILQRICY